MDLNRKNYPGLKRREYIVACDRRIKKKKTNVAGAVAQRYIYIYMMPQYRFNITLTEAAAAVVVISSKKSGRSEFQG